MLYRKGKMIVFDNENVRKRRTGILMMIFASLCFAIIATLVKILKSLPLMEVIFFQSLPSMVILPILLRKKNISPIGNNLFLLLFRCVLTFGCIIACFYTLRTMTIADAMILRQIGPIFVIIFAIVFLKEKFTYRKAPIIILSLLGSIMIIKPGLRVNLFPALIGIIGAALGGGAHAIIRNLRLTDNPFVVMNYYSYFTGILSLIIIFLSGEQFTIISSDYYLLFILGLINFFAQYFLTLAYRNTEASSISLYAYLQIIFCTIFGMTLFHEIPDLFSIAGAILVIFSGYLNYKISIY